MMKEDDLSSTVVGSEGHDKQYSLSEFKEYLIEDDGGGGDSSSSLCSSSSTEQKNNGWVFWNLSDSETKIEETIKRVLEVITSSFPTFPVEYLIQFWEPKFGDDGECVQLTTSDRFALGRLSKGLCSYRKRCMSYSYSFSTKGGAEKAAEELGPVERAYRSKYPESSPDLRLYSTREFPLSEYAAKCGGRNYLALPIFDLHEKENICYGVMELLSFDHQSMADIFSCLEQILKGAGLRSAHIGFVPVISMQQPQPKTEITKMLELTMEVFPQLHLAQAWVPCNQYCCHSCMDRATSVIAEAKIANSFKTTFDYDLFQYLNACEFHNLQKVVSLDQNESWFCRNVCDYSISDNPLAHYAQKARLSSCLTVFLENVCDTNEIYLVEFFLQSNNKSTEDGASFVQLLSRIIETEFKSFFKLKSQVEPDPENQLPEEINMVRKEYNKQYSLPDFTKLWQKKDLYRLMPSKDVNNEGRASLSSSNSPVKEKITDFMSQIMLKKSSSYCLVQFWAPKVCDDGCRYLATSDQPFGVGCLEEGLASFRKQSIELNYRVDEGAKDEQVGPIGRVFRHGHPEFTPDLRLYSKTEFTLRNFAACCCLREYFVLPVFDINDIHQHECLGVLEFVQFIGFPFERIQKALEAVNLSSRSRVMQSLPAETSLCWRNVALSEIEEALQAVAKIPQLHMAEVWAPCTQCASNSRCMERTLSTHKLWDVNEFYHIHTRKGISGMVLASDSKSCFFQNSGRFSITEHPLSHYMQRARSGPCFAIGLQSSHTEDLVYVFEFFMNQGPTKHEFVSSFLKCLLPIMKEKLKSFTVASGGQLVEELAIEVPIFPGEEELNLSELNQQDLFLHKFKFVHKGHQNSEDGQDNIVSDSSQEGKKKIDGLHLNEYLKPCFGKRLKDVEEEFDDGRSTIKRACRDYGAYNRCQSDEEEHKENPETETESADEDASSGSSEETNVPSSSSSDHQNVLQTSDEEVMIRSMYLNDVIKFPLHLSSGVDKIKEQIGRRLNFEMASFKLKCLDEDGDHVLLACDDDLQLCAKHVTASGKTCVQLFVELL